MYKKVLLAYDGSVEGRRALREGAKLAQLCGAEVFLLAVVENAPALATLEGGVGISMDEQISAYKAILAEAWSGSRPWDFRRRHGWAWEAPHSRSPRSRKRSVRTSSW